MSRVLSFRLRRGRSHALLTVALLAGIMLPSVAIASMQSSARAEEGVATEEVAAEPAPELLIAPKTSTLDPTADQFVFEVEVRNPSSLELAAGSVTVSIGSVPLGSIAELTAAYEAADESSDSAAGADAVEGADASDGTSESASETVEISEAPVAATAADSTQVIEVSVPRDEFPLLFLRPAGVYALHAEYEATFSGAVSGDVGDGSTPTNSATTLRAMTPVVWGSSVSETPVPVTLIVPLVLPETITTLPTGAELGTLAPSLLALFDAAEKHAATIAVDPRILVATRSLGTSAPESATELVSRLERTSNDIFLLQYADADPAAQAALGSEVLMQPLGFAYATSLGQFDPVPAEETATVDGAAGATDGTGDTTTGSGSTASASSEQGASEAGTRSDDQSTGANESSDSSDDGQESSGVPTADQLLGLPNARAAAWPAGGEVDSATLALLQQSGITSVVLDSTNVSNATATRATMGKFEALIADADLAAAARAAIGIGTSTSQAAGAAELASRLALAAESSSSGVVLALDRGAIADSADPRAIITQLDLYPWVKSVAYTTQPQGTATLRAGATTEERRELLRATTLRSAQIDELAPLLVNPEYLTEYQRERLMQSFATRYAAAGVDFAAVDQTIKERDDELLLGVQPVITDNTQLVGSSSRVPITLRNALPFDTAVSLHVAPASAAVSVSERDFVTEVPAKGNATVLVPVHSRVSTGESGLSLEIWDSSREHIFSSAAQHLTLRTAVETIIVIALSAGAALLFGFGIWRSVKRKRAATSASE